VGYGPNGDAMLVNGTTRGVVSVAGSASCQPQPPQTGWWYNPAEGGRGFSIEARGNRLFMAAFHYDASGRATWNFAGGATALDGSFFTSDFLNASGGQTLTGAHQLPVLNGIGPITLAFSDATHGTMFWPGGSTPIERQAFLPNGLAAPPQANLPESGWWWNPQESGAASSWSGRRAPWISPATCTTQPQSHVVHHGRPDSKSARDQRQLVDVRGRAVDGRRVSVGHAHQRQRGLGGDRVLEFDDSDDDVARRAPHSAGSPGVLNRARGDSNGARTGEPAAPRRGVAAVGGVATFLAVVISLHVVQPGYDPAQQLMSELALGPNGGFMVLAFAGIGVAFLAILCSTATLGASRSLRGVLAVAAMFFFAAGIFPLGEAATIHIASIAAAFVCAVLAIYLFPALAGRAAPLARVPSPGPWPRAWRRAWRSATRSFRWGSARGSRPPFSCCGWQSWDAGSLGAAQVPRLGAGEGLDAVGRQGQSDP
jgi:hypothetical protein